MSNTLENSDLQLTINPAASTWSVESRGIVGPAILNAHMGVRYRRGRRIFQALEKWPSLAVGDREKIASPHGMLRQRSLNIGPDRQGVGYRLTFAVAEDHPLLIWKLRVENRSRRPLRVSRLEMLRVGFSSVSGVGSSYRSWTPRGRFLLSREKDVEPAFLSQGWGSWSPSRVYGALDKFQKTRLGWFATPMWNNPGTPMPVRHGHFASDMYAVVADRKHRGGILVGFLSQKQHFGSIEALINPLTSALSLWANGDDALLEPGASMETDWASLHFLHLDTRDPLEPYLEAVARENQALAFDLQDIPVGWCSWYHYFQNISAQTIRDNLQAARQLRPALPLQLIQIDDGYQSQIGDWQTFQKDFPQGPAPLAAEIRDAGFTPGVWLAPFILHPRSRLGADHPGWVLRNRLGRPVNAGFVWNTFTRALDITHPDALDCVREVVHSAVHDWGFPYLKLDFLYAAALPGRRRDPTLTRAQVLRRGLETIRRAAGPETTLLACGCPLGSAIGLFEIMRVGPDVAPAWLPKQFQTHIFFNRERSMPAARNAIQNTLARAPLHRRWWVNDPDCLLLRPETELTLAEVQTLAAVISLTGGSLLVSDDLSRLPPERLPMAQVLLPLIGQRPHVLDWMDGATPCRLQLDLAGPCGSWHVLALFNWEDQARDLTLHPRDFYLEPQGAYHARSFWSGEILSLPAGGDLVFRSVPPHGSIVLALRPQQAAPLYLGSDMHISQGLEVAQWETARGALRFSLQRPGHAKGHVDLFLPASPLGLETHGAENKETLLKALPGSIYRLPLEFHQHMELRLRF